MISALCVTAAVAALVLTRRPVPGEERFRGLSEGYRWFYARTGSVVQQLQGLRPEERDRRRTEQLRGLHPAVPAQDSLFLLDCRCIAGCLLGLAGGAWLGVAGGLEAGSLFTALLAGAAMLWALDQEVAQQWKKHEQSLLMAFPDFVMRLVLLTGAGVTLWRAWETTAESIGGSTPLGQALQLSLAEYRSGFTEWACYERFGQRCRHREIMRFSMMLTQTSRLGGQELTRGMRGQAEACWDIRRSQARRIAEETGTAMLLPMTLMLLAVMVMVGVPAVLSVMMT